MGMMMFSKQTYQEEKLLFWRALLCFQMPVAVKLAAIHPDGSDCLQSLLSRAAR